MASEESNYFEKVFQHDTDNEYRVNNVFDTYTVNAERASCNTNMIESLKINDIKRNIIEITHNIFDK